MHKLNGLVRFNFDHFFLEGMQRQEPIIVIFFLNLRAERILNQGVVTLNLVDLIIGLVATAEGESGMKERAEQVLNQQEMDFSNVTVFFFSSFNQQERLLPPDQRQKYCKLGLCMLFNFT